MSDPTALALIRELAVALDEAEVPWCHWRGAANRARALRGEAPLDVLVARGAAPLATSIARAHGWKRLRRPPSEELPGVDEYCGLDRSGRPVHLLLSTRVWIGGSMGGELALPLERALIEGRSPGNPIPFAAPEAEKVLWGIGWALGDVRSDARGGQPPVPAEAVDTFLRALPEVDPARFRELLQAAERGSPMRERRHRRWLTRSLGTHRRYGAAGSTLAASRRTSARATRWLRGMGPPRNQSDAGGALVAFLGSDGSGKSSLIDALRATFAAHLDVATAHMGKPPRSLRLRLVDRLVGIGNRLSRTSEPPALGAPLWLQWLKAEQHLAMAKSRQRECRRLRRLVGQGFLVLCDRYPRADLGLMESPEVRQLSRAHDPRIARIANREEQIYACMPEPELTLLLRVSPETAVRRKPEEAAPFVCSRALAIAALAEQAPADVRQIDAERPFSEVEREARAAVWEIL